MHVVIVGPQVKREDVLVGHEQNAILLEAVSIVFGHITRIKKDLIRFQCLTHVQRARIYAKRVKSRNTFHFININTPN